MKHSFRILLVNSNTSAATTQQVANAARALAPEVEFTAIEGRFGPAGIGGRADLVISAQATLEAALEAAPGHDAVIVACFSDPGLAALREVLDIPVVGIGESAYLTASMLGARFSVVSPGARVAPIIHEAVHAAGLSSRFGGVTLLDDSVIHATDRTALLVEGVARAVATQAAEVVVLGGAVFAGLVQAVAEQSQVPVVGSVEAAVVQALALCRLRAGRAAVGSYSRPRRKLMTGVAPVIAQHLAIGGEA
jgi:Asp/Glu/hydantoin racemase